MTIFAQDAANELKIVKTSPSSSESIERFSDSWEFVFSQNAIVADNAVKELEIKNAANEVIACVGLANASGYQTSIFTGLVPIDTIWNEWYDEYSGETIKYPSMVYPTGLDTPGTYTMLIPAGTFVSQADNNIAIAETTLTFNVVGKQPKWWSDFDYQPTVNEFNKVTISFENVTDLKLDNNVIPYIITPAGNDEDGVVKVIEEKDKEGNALYKIEITFSKYTEEGTPYEIIIPAGMFTMNGNVKNEEKELSFTIVKPADVTPLEIVSQGITPKINENGELEEIAIVYNQRVLIGKKDWSSYAVYITDSNGNRYSMWPKDPYDYNGALVIPGNTVVLMPVKLNAEGYPYEMNEFYQYIASPVAMECEYTLNLADITVRYGYDAAEYAYKAFGSIEGTYTFDKNTTAIEDVEAEAKGTVTYDLTGRRINEITKAGIYIVNGVKRLLSNQSKP
jgi:hypothetical protein